MVIYLKRPPFNFAALGDCCDFKGPLKSEMLNFKWENLKFE